VKRIQGNARRRLAAASRANDAELGGRPEPGSAQEASVPAPVVMVEPAATTVADDVPRGVRIAAAWGWRFLVLAAVGLVIFRAISTLSLVVIPVVVSLLLAALLQPVVAWLRRHGVPRTLAAVIVLVTGIAAVAGTLTIVIQAFVDGFSDLNEQVQQGIDKIRNWLVEGPLHLSTAQLDDAVDSAQKAITDNQDSLTAGAVSTATTLGHVLTGFFLVLFTTFFFLKDGRTIWTFLVGFLPRGARDAVSQAGDYSWRTLIAYVRATVLVAFVDGLAVYVIGVPLALPLGALVFLGAFIPVIGATLSGAVAVLVALVAKGPVAALLVFAAVIAVQQLEGHVLQPLLLGRAVALHPLGVIVALAAGVVLAGIVGALVAVPLVAVVNTAVRYLVAHPRGEPVPPDEPDPPGTEPTDEDEALAEQTRTDAAETAAAVPTTKLRRRNNS
jgi:predicted PurR-regulated permease PerM